MWGEPHYPRFFNRLASFGRVMKLTTVVVLGLSKGGPMALLFAATCPERPAGMPSGI